MSSTRTLATAGLIVTGAFLASRLLGYVRVVVIATTVGIDRELDTFFAAFRIPDLIFQLVAAGALSSALLPVVSGMLANGQQARAWRVVSTVANLMLLALAVLAAIVFVGAPAFVPVITPGFSPAEIATTVELTRIMLISPIMLALGAVATSALNAQGRFAASAVAPIVYNIGIIGGAVLLAPTIGVHGLAIGVVGGSIAHVAIQLRPLVSTGFRYAPVVELDDPDARKALALMGPRAIGLGATQITFVAMTAFASGLAPGSVATFNIAMTLLQIPLGVIGVPLGIVILPALARELATGRVGEFLDLVGRGIRLLLFVMLPITAIGMVLRREVVVLLFDYGRFTTAAVDDTAATLLVFLAGLAAHALIAVLARAFYAGQDTITPVVAAVGAVIANVVAGALLVGPFGLPGLAAAIAGGAWLEAVILVIALRRRYPGLDLPTAARTFVRSAIGSVVAAALAFAVLGLLGGAVGEGAGRLGVLVVAGAAAGAGAVGYLAMSVLLRVPELPALVGVTMGLIRRTPAS